MDNSRVFPLWIIFLIFIFSGYISAQLTVKDTDQDATLGETIQNVRDSLQLIYQEELNRKVDSLKNLFQEKQDKLLGKLQERREVNYQYIKKLEDSLQIYKDRATKYQFRNSVRDSGFEAKYYKYIDELLEYKDKERKNILGVSIGGREINEFKIQVLNDYLEKYRPRGKSSYVQYYLTQVYMNQKNYAMAELSFLRYLYFYTDSPAYNDIKHSQLELILNTNYFKDRTSHLVKIMDNIDKDADFKDRYYNFIKELKAYPNQEINKYFIDEIHNYLSLFGDLRNSSRLLYTLYEYYLEQGKVQYAFLTLEKIIQLFPEYPESDLALFKQAEIRTDHFKEYNEALSDYNRYIEENPESRLAEKGYIQIARIFDNYLQKYDMAFNKYKQFADKYPDSEFTAEALKRAATILENRIKDKQEAINLYMQLAEKYKTSETGQKAREKAANLYYDEGQYRQAVDQFYTLYEQEPMNKESIDYLLRIADIYENKLNNVDKTIETLNHIIENFPGTQEAERARERIDNLSRAKQEEK
jgi:TolA-binding protein